MHCEIVSAMFYLSYRLKEWEACKGSECVCSVSCPFAGCVQSPAVHSQQSNEADVCVPPLWLVFPVPSGVPQDLHGSGS